MIKFTVVSPKNRLLALIFIGGALIFPVNLLRISILHGSFFLVLWGGIFFFSVIHQCFIKSIEISSKGVRYSTLFKTMEMTWDEIAIIGIGYVPIKGPGKKPWIYFSGDRVAISTLTPRLVNERFYIMNYRQSVIDEIRKYWQNNIVGLDSI